MQLQGTILFGHEFDLVEGTLTIENGHISHIEEETNSSTDIILPAFINSHTHIGDSIAKDAGSGLSLDELVAPPDGLKHRLLSAATPEDLISQMRKSINLMESTGVAAFADFREGGVDGVNMLQKAHSNSNVDAIILGRETIDVLDIADGFGASGSRDSDFTHERKSTKTANKLFGIHAGERDKTDIETALALEPDFVVHMVHPTSEHLDHLQNTNTPVVICPRSNIVTGVGLPPIEDLLCHTTIALGTDNVMLNSPSLFREMAFVSKLFDIDPREILRMATSSGATIFDLNYGILEPDREAKILVLDGDSNNLSGSSDIISSIVRRASPSDIKQVYL
ncbi:MAG: amidohydrolase family protein [Halobacteriales archaeon]|nr:amidohydrolase family protein [Halobacteriales archaeon]|tara:strand:+ start:36 stop:1049 length:1014 start_codon:yes stop_codon:yes gene_type:complete